MNFIKKYICELVLVINVFLIVPNHNFKVWWERPIINDAMGYYAYLPAVFIYHDLTYNSLQEPWAKHNKDVPGNDVKIPFIVKYKGHEVNKYPPGVAYFEAPFFLMAHISAKLFGAEADGYSDIYMYFMCIAALFWQYIFFTLLGRIYSFYNLSPTVLAISVPILSFGTNILFYTQIFGGYSHIYSLLSISLFFYAGLKFFDQFPNPKSSKYFFWMAIAFGLAIITRNLNVLSVLLLPCMGFKFKELFNYLIVLKNKFAISGLLVSLGLVLSMLIFWKLQTGYWLIDSYPDEHFNWGKPQILKNLFSAHKGWFFYTPIALISIIGLFFAPCKLRLNMFLVLLLIIYVTSSWEYWDYGTGFSMRPYIDWYLIIALGLGFLLQQALSKKVVLYSLISLLIIFSCINMLWSYQFVRGIISGNSQGIEYIVKNFFRLRPIMEFKISKKLIMENKLVENNFNDDLQHPFSIIEAKIPFSKGLELKLDDYFPDHNYNHIRYGATIKMNDLENNVYLCCSIVNQKDSSILWNQTSVLSFVKKGEFEKVESGFFIPENIPPHSKIKVFFWEPEGNTACTIDDMYIEFIRSEFE